MTIDRNARILDIQTWDDYYLFTVESPAVGLQARPGQFVMVKAASEPYPLLRRPLSLHDADSSGIALFFKIAGTGTEILARKRPDDSLDLIGPLGKGFTISGSFKGKRVVLIGGGRGIAPLYFLGKELQARGAVVKVLYGGRCVTDMPLRLRFEAAGLRLSCSTDDGTFGFCGLVTDLLRDELASAAPDSIFACGPDLMMKAVAEKAQAAGIPAEFSLESVMGCGIGACWGCVHRIRNEDGEGWTKICEEGPVFPGDRIVWED